MFKKILIAITLLILALVVIITLQPNDFQVSRSESINAAPEIIFVQVNNLKNWNAWSPWAKLDPNAKYSLEGPIEGSGAIQRWAGNDSVGEGSMTIIESHPNELVKFQLDFLKPFAGTNFANFTFTPKDNQTIVTWSMYGKKNFITKAIGLVIDCDDMIGGQFEKGLKQLKDITESSAKN